MTDARITWTYTDEAPALATHSFLPVLEAFAGAAGVEVEVADISLAARILAVFGDHLAEDQRVPDALAELGALALTAAANIVKLPNISASVPQLKEAIAELQAQGYALPDYPDDPSTDDQRDARARYDTVKGSAVNPVLREGNSDRRAPKPVKDNVKLHPHSMGEWSSDSASHVATMDGGDFFANEQSVTLAKDDTLRIELVGDDGAVTVLRESLPVLRGEVVDATYLSKAALLAFLAEQIADAREQGVLFSLHMKATMMKVSDPIIFGHAVRVFLGDVFTTHADALASVGADPNDGLGAVLRSLEELPDDQREAIEADIAAARAAGPSLAMVDSRRDITNLHVPSDVIIDASMPAMIRTGGQMWNADDETQDAKATIPDSSYAALYQETIGFCQEHGAFDPTTMGTVPNVGLMAKKAEEYGSHDKTFEVPHAGTVRVVDASGVALLAHEVEAGDIWRACQTKDAPVRDWVELAVRRARATGWPAVFWLDETRAHDRELLAKVRPHLASLDTDGLDVRVMDVAAATRFTLARAAAGENTISVTGNVLRDYLTDLFPILELGTSAKMLSIVPLMNGGGLFETGAGGSAPKHVQQFVQEGHLRWDSLGEFLALAVSLEHHAEQTGNAASRVLAEALEIATGRYLSEGRGPSRKVGEPDNRTSHVFVAAFWARAIAEQRDDKTLAARFAPLAARLEGDLEAIVAALDQVQGEPVELHGYYRIDRALADAAMRPVAAFNDALTAFVAEG
jgi:isocitrate dehydrogenase